METEKIEEYIGLITNWAITTVPKIILAIVVLYIGLFIAKKLGKAVGVILDKSNIEIELRDFLVSLINTLLKVAVFLIAASVAGIKLTALFALLAAAGFAVGMALQGFLGNFASGLTILFLKPYRVNDWVQVSDSFGKVQSIQLFNTTLITPSDKTLIIPNGQVTDNIITNLSTQGNIRLELTISMPYEESFPRVKKIINDAVVQSKYVIAGTETLVGIENYDSHNILLTVRPYIHPDDFWDAKFDVNERIKAAFSAHNVKAAYSEGVELGPIGD
jgi:small conductance mechanosensitive channel